VAALPQSPPISIHEYLETIYEDGDREFVDGQVLERNLGEIPHSLIQANLIEHFRARYRHLFVWAEQRIICA